MRRSSVVLVVAAALMAIPSAVGVVATPPNELALQKVGEAKRLELQALELFKANTADPKPEELVSESAKLLDQAKAMVPIRAKGPLHGAAGEDTSFVRDHKAGNTAAALQHLETAILIKDAGLQRIEEASWPREKVETKATPPTPVPA